MKDYIEFLKDKMAISHQTGFEVTHPFKPSDDRG